MMSTGMSVCLFISHFPSLPFFTLFVLNFSLRGKKRFYFSLPPFFFIISLYNINKRFLQSSTKEEELQPMIIGINVSASMTPLNGNNSFLFPPQINTLNQLFLSLFSPRSVYFSFFFSSLTHCLSIISSLSSPFFLGAQLDNDNFQLATDQRISHVNWRQ